MKETFPVILFLISGVRFGFSQVIRGSNGYGNYAPEQRAQFVSQRGILLRGQSGHLDVVSNGFPNYHGNNHVSTKFSVENGLQYRNGINGLDRKGGRENGYVNGANGNGPKNGHVANGGNGYKNGRVTNGNGRNGYNGNVYKNGKHAVTSNGNGPSFNFADEARGNGLAVFGNPGVDFPIYAEIPQTGFQCSSQVYPGYYADTETRCQVFHICQHDGRQHSFLCPNATIFSQKHFVCAWWSDVNCQDAMDYYPLNEKLYQELESKLQNGNSEQYY